MEGESEEEKIFQEVRSQLIQEISVSICRTVQSAKKLNNNLAEANLRAQKISDVSELWNTLTASGKHH